MVMFALESEREREGKKAVEGGQVSVRMQMSKWS
jgi:hypothetical protein